MIFFKESLEKFLMKTGRFHEVLEFFFLNEYIDNFPKEFLDFSWAIQGCFLKETFWNLQKEFLKEISEAILGWTSTYILKISK